MPRAEVAAGRVMTVAIGIGITVAFTVVVALALLARWDLPPGADAPAPGAPLPATVPALAPAPQDDLAAYRREQADRLNTLRWRDRARGRAEVPIEDAIRLRAEPAVPAAELESRPGALLQNRAQSSESTLLAAELHPRPGAMLPRAVPLRDAAGASHAFGAWFDGRRPVLLGLGYHACEKLCGLAMHEMMQRWRDAGLPADAARIVAVSIDPADTPASARERSASDRAFARWLGGPLPDVERLTAEAGRFASVEAIARAAGFGFEPRNAPGESIAHPAVWIVATPEGRVAGYLPEIGLQASALRAALIAARAGGDVPLTERIALVCDGLEAMLGAKSAGVLTLVRAAVGAATVALALLVLVLAVRRRRKR